MPNKHAAIKDVRKSRKHAAKNARMKTHVRSLTRQFNTLIKDKKKEEATTLAQVLQQALDKAAKNNVIHPNKAAREISSNHRAITKAV